MKKPRCFAYDSVWRIAFAFGPERKAILLTAGDRAGIDEQCFYRKPVARADESFNRHLAAQERRKLWAGT